MVTFSDPLVSRQWHFRLLGDINTIWNEYSGAGITVGVYDDGLQYTHPDLDGNYDSSLHFTDGGLVFDPAPIDLIQDGHGTSVAGLIAAEAGNGIGGVGVAWGATLTGVNLLSDPRFYDGSGRDLLSFQYFAAFDIVNNSWGYDPFFDPFLDRGNPFEYGAAVESAFAYAALNGRDGLGTLIVKSAGNEAYNANGEGLNGSRFVVSVAALDSTGQVQSYSNYGSNILVSAGAASVTTDLTGTGGYNSAAGSAGNYASDFGGTSAAAPVVSGVIALMLDANEGLGWRDVRDILASSARLTGSIVTGNQANEVSGTYYQDNSQRGGTWNDGGRGYSLDYGFGNVDAFAAVRMAEIWSLFGEARTSENEAQVTVSRSDVQLDMSDLGASERVELEVVEGLRIENIDLTISGFLSPIGSSRELTVTVQAPDYTSFPVLINLDDIVLPSDGSPLTWTFGITHALGMFSEGTWRVMFEMSGFAGFILNVAEVTLDFYGSYWDVDSVHHITRDFLLAHSTNSGDGRDRVIDDNDGGSDWINMSSVASAITATLDPSGRIVVGGQQWATIAAGALIENIVTSDGADNLTGSSLANQMHSMRGNDTVSGLGGNDTLDGGAGNDRLSGGTEDDDVIGGSGNDTLFGGAGNDDLSGGDGVDSLNGGTGNDVASGGSGNDLLYGLDGDDSLFADAGDDQVFGGIGNDDLDGGSDNDTLSGEDGNDQLDGGAGTDILEGGAGADTLLGGEGNDIIIVSAFADHAAGESIVGDIGTDELRFTGATAGTLILGADVAVERVVIGTGTAAAAVLTGTAAINVDASALAQGVTLIGNAGGNRLTGTALNDSLNGWAGNDTLVGGAGDDTLTGGLGIDVASYASATADLTITLASGPLAVAGFGTDSLAGIEGLEGGSGNDSLTGTTGANLLLGGVGNDTLAGGLGDDTLTGGEGLDTASYADAASGVTVNLGLATAQVTGGAGTDVLGGIETLIGSGFNDVLTGNAGANRIEAGVGNDILVGGAGADTLLGGEGNDIMVISAFADHAAGESIVGDAGTDELRFTGATAGTLILGADVAVERVVIGTGTAAAAVLTGTAAINVDVSALAQAVTVIGNAGANSLTGSALNDSLNGRAGNDTLAGGDGQDKLLGGGGNDLLTGGAAADEFVFNSRTSGVDVITDFNSVNGGTDDGDVLRFEGLGVGTFSYVGSGAFTGGLNNSEARVVGGQVLVDTNGDGVADITVTLTGLTNANQLTVDDFLFV